MLFRDAFWTQQHRQQQRSQQPGAYCTEGARKLEELGPIANLFPTRIDKVQPGLIGLVTAGRARRFVQLPAEQQREEVLRQLSAYFSLPQGEVEARMVRFVVHTFAGDEFARGW